MSALFRRTFYGPISRTVFRPLHLSATISKILQYKLADIGEGIAEVQVKEWLVNVGDNVSEFDEICSVQSDKASVTITSRYKGIVSKLYCGVDDIVKVGQPLIDIDDGERDGSSPQTNISEPSTELNDAALSAQSDSSTINKKFLATPAVRRLIRENNIDLANVHGTGRDGRILKEDILKHIGVDSGESVDKSSHVPGSPPQISKRISTEQEEIVPIRGYTRAMIKSMTEALKIPHFGYNDEFVVDKLIHLRDDLNELGRKNGRPKISYMPLIIKATSLALKEFPVLNSSIDAQMDNLIYKNYHNISLAMDTPGGLAVPNIKNCESKNVWEIAADLSRLLELGQKQKFSNDDLINGTFSLSNIGAIGGGTYMKPVIFPPQVAIGAIGRIQKVVRLDADGSPYERSVLNFSWAADHRVVDGATMARFSNHLKQYVESPALMVGDMQ